MDYQENCYKRGTLPSKTYSRVEQYLRELCLLEDAPLPIPQSRIELLLEAIFTGDISKCESPKSREEKLIWALLTGDESDIEKCASRIEVLWYCLVKGLNAEELLGTEVNGKVIEDCMSRIEAYLWYLVKNGGSSLMGVEYELYDFVTTYNTMNTNLLKAVSSGETMNNVVSDNVVSDVQSVVGYGSIGDKVTEKFQSAILNGMTETILDRFENGTYNGWSPTFIKADNTKRIRTINQYSGVSGNITVTVDEKYEVNVIGHNTSTGTGIGGEWTNTRTIDVTNSMFAFIIRKKDGTDITKDEIYDVNLVTSFNQLTDMVSVKMPILHTVGKNLFDGKWIESSSNSTSLYSNPIKVIPNRYYKINLNTAEHIKGITVYFYDINGNEINYQNKTIGLSPNESAYMTWYITRFSDMTKDYLQTITQIEETQNEYSTSTSYEPYKSNILTTNEEVELRAIGDVKDELNLLTGELTQRIGEITFDGSENWETHDTTTTNTVRYYLNGAVQNAKPISEDGGVCDKIPYGRIHGVDEVGVVLTKASGHCYLRSTIRDLSEFKTWLQSNPITVQYQLATEVIKTVDFSIVDQDGNTVEEVKPFTNGHIITSSATLTPELEYTLVESNKFNIPALESKEYTVQNDGTNFTLNNVEYAHGVTENTIDGGSGALTVLPNGYNADSYKSAILKGQTEINRNDTPNTVYEGLNIQGIKYIDIKANIQPDSTYTVFMRVTKNTSQQIGIWGFYVDGATPTGNSSSISFVQIDGSTQQLGYTGWLKAKIKTKNYDNNMYRNHITIGVHSDLGECNYSFTDVMILDGDKTNITSPPIYFEGMQSVRMPVLTTIGKNLFDGEYELDKYLEKDGTPTASADWATTKNHIRVKPNTTYTQNIHMGSPIVYVVFYDKNKNIIGAEIGFDIKNFATYTTPNNCYYIKTCYKYSSVGNHLFQVEEGSISTTYEPYKSNILSTPSDLELRGIGDVQDTLDCLTGEVVQQTIKIPLDSNHFEISRQTSTDQENTIRWQLIFKDKAIADSIKTNSKGLCNIMNYVHGGGQDAECIFIHPSAIPNRLQIKQLRTDTRFTTAQELMSFLMTNKAYVVLELAQPVIKTVDLSIVNQDGEALDKLEYFNNGHIFIESESINPSMTYEANINGFKGTVNVGTVTNNVLTSTDKDIVIVEGNKTNCYIPKFKGMVSCTDMCLEIENEDGSSVLSQYPVNKDVVIRKIKDIEDTFNYLTGEYTRRIGEITFDGSENWETSITSNGKFIGIVYIENGELSNIYDDKEYQWNNGYLFCKDPYLGNLNSCWLHKVDNNTTQFRLMLDGTQTLADEFKAYVTNNPITIQYSLAEPIVTKVDVNLTKDAMRSFEGITKFRVKNNDSKLFPNKTVVTVRTSNDTDLALLSDEISTLSLKQNDTSNTISNTSEDIENVSNGLNEINSLLE